MPMTRQTPGAKRYLRRSVRLTTAKWSQGQRSVTRRSWCQQSRSPRKYAISSPSATAASSPAWCPTSCRRKCAGRYPKKCATLPWPIPTRSSGQCSSSGAPGRETRARDYPSMRQVTCHPPQAQDLHPPLLLHQPPPTSPPPSLPPHHHPPCPLTLPCLHSPSPAVLQSNSN